MELEFRPNKVEAKAKVMNNKRMLKVCLINGKFWSENGENNIPLQTSIKFCVKILFSCFRAKITKLTIQKLINSF